jgi:nickel-type superoxide dismutase maturation protease
MAESLRPSNWRDLLLWLLRARSRFRVTGHSMLPLLQPGEEILINPHAYRQQPPQPGDLVVAQHPFKPNLRLVKRVIEVREDGSCFIVGDNATESTDSRHFGSLALRSIKGQVVCRFP